MGPSVKQQFESDLTLEQAALTVLKPGIKTCLDAHDDASRELLEHIVVDEEHHIDWIETQFHQISDRLASMMKRETHCWPDAAFGKLTGMPLNCVIDKVEIMKKTSKKKIVSIIGMISMRAFLCCGVACASVFPRLLVQQ